MNDLRVAYLGAARAAVNLLSRRELGDRWTRPSLLVSLEVGELAAHLARAILQVEWFLDMPEPDPPVITAAEYYRPLVDSADPDSPTSVGMRQRAATTAAGGWARLYLDATRARHGDQAVLHALTRRELDQAQALRVL